MPFSATGLHATGAVLGTKRTMSETVKTGSFWPHVEKWKIRMSEDENRGLKLYFIQFFEITGNT